MAPGTRRNAVNIITALGNINNDETLLVEFPNELDPNGKPKCAVGFKAWAEQWLLDVLDTIICEKRAVRMQWPMNQNIQPASEKVKKKLSGAAFEEVLVRILDHGKWTEMCFKLDLLERYGVIDVSKSQRGKRQRRTIDESNAPKTKRPRICGRNSGAGQEQELLNILTTRNEIEAVSSSVDSTDTEMESESEVDEQNRDEESRSFGGNLLEPTDGGEQTTTGEALSELLHSKDDEIAQLKRQIAEMTRPQSSNQPPSELAGSSRENTLRKESLGQVRRRIVGDNDAGGSLDSGDKDLSPESVIMPDGDDSGISESDAELTRHGDSLGESGAGLAEDVTEVASGAIVMAEGGAGLAGVGIALAENSTGQSGSAAGLAAGGARPAGGGTEFAGGLAGLLGAANSGHEGSPNRDGMQHENNTREDNRQVDGAVQENEVDQQLRDDGREHEQAVEHQENRQRQDALPEAEDMIWCKIRGVPFPLPTGDYVLPDDVADASPKSSVARFTNFILPRIFSWHELSESSLFGRVMTINGVAIPPRPALGDDKINAIMNLLCERFGKKKSASFQGEFGSVGRNKLKHARRKHAKLVRTNRCRECLNRVR